MLPFSFEMKQGGPGGDNQIASMLDTLNA